MPGLDPAQVVWFILRGLRQAPRILRVGNLIPVRDTEGIAETERALARELARELEPRRRLQPSDNHKVLTVANAIRCAEKHVLTIFDQLQAAASTPASAAALPGKFADTLTACFRSKALGQNRDRHTVQVSSRRTRKSVGPRTATTTHHGGVVAHQLQHGAGHVAGHVLGDIVEHAVESVTGGHSEESH